MPNATDLQAFAEVEGHRLRGQQGRGGAAAAAAAAGKPHMGPPGDDDEMDEDVYAIYGDDGDGDGDGDDDDDEMM